MMAAMTKHLSIDLTYDAPLSEVTAMLADPAFRERVCEAQHALTKTVKVEGHTVAITYTQPVRGVPGFAKKFVGDTIDVHQDETWSEEFTRGEIAVSLPGKPGQLSGTATVAERGDKTVETVALTASVSVPLVGGKLEELVLSIFEKALTKEHEVGTAWLRGE